LLNYAGLAVFFGSPWSLLLIPVVVWLMNLWVIMPEETYLARKFGNVYAQYSSTVRRWI
jgi:protein-S-isoprenylcysteine O-methyltransferase Ste14